MFLWIRDQKWLPAAAVALTVFLLAGGLDLMFQGPLALVSAVILCSSIFFSRSIPWLTLSLAVFGLSLTYLLGLQPQLSQLAVLVSLLLIFIFANKKIQLVSAVCIVLIFLSGFNLYLYLFDKTNIFYGLDIQTSSAKATIAVAGSLIILVLSFNSIFLGRLLNLQFNHVGTDYDKALMERELAQAQITAIEQARRFGIAKDVTEVLVDRLSSTAMLAEAGKFTISAEPSSAPRIFENVIQGLNSSYAELRRLSEIIDSQEMSAKALPGLRDINGLVVAFRELGYEINYRQTGTALELDDGAAVTVYRIVFESLENTKRHAPLGTGIDIDLIWQPDSLRVLVKDNGEETRRSLLADNSGYSVAEDQKALVEHLTGPSLKSLAERVQLFEGVIEFTRVPGVGFNVSASFPSISKHLKKA
jgi:signal transduction histidine kinase